MSESDVVPNWSALRISSNVWPAAPFIVIPSAKDALSGETKILVSGVFALSCFQSVNENALADVRTCCSCAESARGKSVRAGRFPGSGDVPPAQPIAAMAPPSATAVNSVDGLVMQVSGLCNRLWHNQLRAGNVTLAP